jgi:hypothetical protein
VIERAYVETVTGNKARFCQKREGEAAEAGKDLLSKFARGWRGVTDQVEKQWSVDRCARHEKSKDDLEADRSVHEGEDQPAKAADSDSRHER